MLTEFLSKKLEEMLDRLSIKDVLKGRKYCYRKGFEDCASVLVPSLKFIASLEDERMKSPSRLLELSKEDLVEIIVENTKEARFFFK